MSSRRSQDRASLCSFTFADGRRCRSPRQSGHLQYCCDHARKQAQAQAAEDIGRDAGYFFSGRYLSACDLNAALGRVFAATAQGHVKPKLASALAYLAQVMVQCIQISQQEYAGAFGGDGWRGSIKSSVNSNSDYLNPPEPEQPSAPVGAGFSPSPASSPAAPPSSAPSPQAPMPPTRTEFVQQVLAGLQTGENGEAGRNSSRPPRAPQGSGREPSSAAPNPVPHASSSSPTPTPHPSSQRPQPTWPSNPPSSPVGAGFSPSPTAHRCEATPPPAPASSAPATPNPPSPLDASVKPDLPAPSSAPAPRRFGPPGIEGNPDYRPLQGGPVHFPWEK